MPRKNTKGTRQVSGEVAEAVVEVWRKFLEGRPESARWHLEMALIRHAENPPPLPEPPPKPPPLPPVPPPDKPRRKKP